MAAEKFASEALIHDAAARAVADLRGTLNLSQLATAELKAEALGAK